MSHYLIIIFNIFNLARFELNKKQVISLFSFVNRKFSKKEIIYPKYKIYQIQYLGKSVFHKIIII